MNSKRLFLGVIALVGITASPLIGQDRSAQLSPDFPQALGILRAVHHDVSPALRDISPIRPGLGRREHDLGRIRPGVAVERDPVVQSSVGIAVGTTPGKGFDGLGVPNSVVSAAPPDTNGSPGARTTLPGGQVIDQYVQWVNEAFAVFDKGTGTIIYGPAAGNTLWTGFGGPCETHNDGDPIAQYDKAANRWVLMQLSLTGGPPFYQCVAVSTTPDATGTYSRYAFQYNNTNDYPKLGVWPDAYYVSFNMFQGNTFLGSQVCAYDRNAMLTGASATQQCFQLSPSYGGLLPSDLDGATPPPAGSPNFFVAFDTNVLQLWKFHVDWTTPANSTLTGPLTLPVASFSMACNGGTCIPQKGTSQTLDSLGDRLMYRLAYRSFPDGHEALVVNHSVNAGSNIAGVRWYELRNPSGSTMAAGTPVVYQQSTYAPDSTYRWMGSIAMDNVGNIALGYSVSSTAINPGIHYTGRAPGDPLGLMGVETSIVEGTGSQTGGLSRWGDYSSMSVDPTDDCTLWYTNEYLKTNGKFNWSTRIASFKFTNCGGNQPASLTVNGSAAPITVAGGATVNVGIQNDSNAYDWVGLYATGSTAAALKWDYLNGRTTIPFTMPSSAGTYEFRLYDYNGYNKLATSPAVTVQTGGGPTVTAIIPTQGTVGSSVPVTITGTNFQSGATLSVGAGITVSGVAVSSGTQLTATLVIAAGATLGARDVTVTNPGGQSGTLFSGFTVSSASGQPSLTVNGSSAAITVAPGATVAVGVQNDTNAYDWVGMFLTGSTTNLTWDYLNGRTTIPFTMPSSAGTYEFRLYDYNGYNKRATSPAVTVQTGGGPTVTAITPTQGTVGSSVPVMITGTNFQSGATLSVGAGITVSGVAVSSGTQLTATLVIAAGATLGAHNVTVTNPGGQSGTLFSGFTVSTASAQPSLTVNGSSGAITVAPGATVTVGVQNDSNAYDWVGLFPTGSTTNLTWSYLNGRTNIPFTMPSSAGTYEFRLYDYNAYNKRATSPPVTVQ